MSTPGSLPLDLSPSLFSPLSSLLSLLSSLCLSLSLSLSSSLFACRNIVSLLSNWNKKHFRIDFFCVGDSYFSQSNVNHLITI